MLPSEGFRIGDLDCGRAAARLSQVEGPCCLPHGRWARRRALLAINERGANKSRFVSEAVRNNQPSEMR